MIKIVVLILLLIAAWVSLRSVEPRTLYYPDRTLIVKPSVYRMAYEDLHLSADDGTKINGWFIPGTKPITLLFCHGNAGNISSRLDKLAKFHTLGVKVLIFDFRGDG